MDTLRIRWDGGEGTYEPGTLVRVGRDPDAEVQPHNTNVSRRHVEISHSASGWVLRDVGSGQGTWKDGRQVDTLEVRGTVRVTLGREGRGEVLTLEAKPSAPLVGATELPGRAATAGPTEVASPLGPRGQSGSAEGTVVVGGGPNRPGGALRADEIAEATVVTGDVLNVECAGRSASFRPGDEVSIGRDADCEMVSTNPTVSRRHASITHDGTGWTLRDEASSGGTYVDGRRISELRLEGSVAAWLGDPTTGERVVIVASGTNPRTSRRRLLVPLVAGGAAVVVLLLVIVAAVLVSGGEDAGPSNDELGQATVRLLAGDFAGSGTIVDAERGLILTNAHVVAPDALGTGVRDLMFGTDLLPSPREIEVLVVPELSKAAEPRFVAEVVAVDGYLDLAVLEITKTTGGQLIEPGSGDLDGLVAVEVGDSDELSAGDPIRVFGYPSAAQSRNVTVTEGVVSGQVTEERTGSNRGMLNITADISPGNSGGLTVNDDGELVGVPTLVRDGAVASIRPSTFATAMLEAARAGEPYESPFIRPLSGEEVENFALVAPGRTAGVRFDCTTGPFESVETGAVGLSFDFDGFEAGEHQDMVVVVRVGGETVGSVTLDAEYPVRWPAGPGCATMTVPVDLSEVADPAGEVTVGVGLGPNYTAPG
ncbi:MAG: FHA domain-containing protein [Ilumatobacteraceae bacterium]